ncbi:MAG: tetratricopeptide repeat protein [Deltaproteobacteria bacterium]|nr:tetratricopeptide repeat protein [Deltaproteobacteria bacterium]
MLHAMNASRTKQTKKWDQLVKLARSSHSKKAWDLILDTWGERLAHCSLSRPLEEVFGQLARDPQSLNYNPAIWGCLLRGSLSAWNPQLGLEIHNFSKRIHSPQVSIPAAQLYLESGRSDLARETATRALRLKNLSQLDQLQLSLIIAVSHAEEGRGDKAMRQLQAIQADLGPFSAPEETYGDVTCNLGRIHFFLGNYSEAARHYASATAQYREARNWEAVAKTIFNTAICHLSGENPNRQEAFTFMAECRRIAESEDLPGPLAHCEASLGVDAFERGNYTIAREHLRRALAFLPGRDFGYCRLRIISTLADTYLAVGRVDLATKFGLEALDIAAKDPGVRRHMRHLALKAELFWESGDVEESQSVLINAGVPHTSHGVSTIDEITALSRYYLQSSLVNTDLPIAKSQLKPTLARNKHFYLEYIYALGELALAGGDLREAQVHFNTCYAQGLAHGLAPQTANGLFGQIKLALHEHRCKEAESRLTEFRMLTQHLGQTPRNAHVMMIEAAIAYQTGQFAQCRKLLRAMQKLSRIHFADRFALGAWEATLNGHAPRLQLLWQQNLLARYTRAFFAPYLERLDDRNFLVSGHYEVSLERHSSLADMLDYLLNKSNFCASSAEIQTKVWRQSLGSQGWQQKIRNSIMRLRDLFPYTVAPLMIHGDQISLFAEAISLRPGRRQGVVPASEIVRLLDDAPMSSNELAKRLELSPATTKRILKKLVSAHSIAAIKHGRSVYYKSSPDHGSMPP